MDNELARFLADDRAMTLLRTIDRMNPMDVPVNRLSTIREVADVLGWPVMDTWKLIDAGVRTGVLMYCGGVLSRRRVDLTEKGEDVVDTDGTEELRKIIKGEI